jgi:thiamine pyrophosphokinase
LIHFSTFVSCFFFLFFFGCIGRGTLTFDEFCRVAVHFSDEDDEALQLSVYNANEMIFPCHKMICDISHDINFSFSSFSIVNRKELKEAFRLYDKEGEKDI